MWSLKLINTNLGNQTTFVVNMQTKTQPPKIPKQNTTQREQQQQQNPYANAQKDKK